MALLTLVACSEDGEEPEVLEPGPLQLRPASSCTVLGQVMLVGSELENTADIALTIDEVGITGTNLGLDEATLDDGVSAVDATMPEAGHADADQVLMLRLRPPSPDRTSTYAVTVDYHNIEGRFQAVADGADLTALCR